MRQTCNWKPSCLVRDIIFREKLFGLLDLCVSSLRRGHANLFCLVPILRDDPRRAHTRHPGGVQSRKASNLTTFRANVVNFEYLLENFMIFKDLGDGYGFCTTRFVSISGASMYSSVPGAPTQPKTINLMIF